jgi:hypothetical protein
VDRGPTSGKASKSSMMEEYIALKVFSEIYSQDELKYVFLET